MISMRKPGKNRENQYVSYPFPPLTTAPIATACSTRTRSFISSNLISLFLSPAVLNLYQRAASRTHRPPLGGGAYKDGWACGGGRRQGAASSIWRGLWCWVGYIGALDLIFFKWYMDTTCTVLAPWTTQDHPSGNAGYHAQGRHTLRISQGEAPR